MKIVKFLLPIALLTIFLSACKKDDPAPENKPPVVNAGKDTTFQLRGIANDTIQLSGSATDADGSVMGYAWTQMSGPNSAKIHYPGSATTKVSGVVGGQYVFQLMATDDKGATGIKTVTITVKAPQVYNLSLQPHQNQNETMIVVVGSDQVSPHPNTPDLAAAAWTVNGEQALLRSLVKFDLTSIPASAQILSAKLTLYSDPRPTNGNLIDPNFGSSNQMIIGRATSNWSAATASWQNQPATDPSTQILVPHTTQSRLDLVDLDVTELVKGMQASGNYGFSMRLQNEVTYNSRLFCSSKNADATRHPKLVVQYSN